MGYYSDVAVAFTKEGYEKFITYYNQNFLLHKNELKNELEYYEDERRIMNNPEYVAENGEVFFYFPEIKWYKTRLEIQIIMEALNQLDKNEYLYIRLGEDVDDIEKLGRFYKNSFSLKLDGWLKFELPAIREESDMNESISPK